MAKSANIFSKDWCNMVFEFKNKDYGAYILRKESDKRHFTAIIIGTLFFSLAVSTPTILKNILPEKKKDVMLDKTILDLINKEKEKPKEDKPIEVPQEEVRKTIQFVIPKADETVKEEDSVITQKQVVDTKIEVGAVTNLKGDTAQINIEDKPKIDVVEQVYDLAGVEEMPSFPGGTEKLYKFLGEKIKYPEFELSNEITGTVYVQFVVGKDGKIRDVSVLRSVSNGLDGEAVRVIKLLPAWNPGKQNGKPVSVKYILPVKFTLAKQ